jgi:inhibitor of cysteine peptidase
MSDLTVTRADDGGTFRCALGELVQVRLPEVPASGYRWQVLASAGVELVSSDYVHPAESAVGGGGTRVVTLRAVRRSSAPLEFVLKHPWEGEESAVDKVLFTIDVT